MVKPSVRIRLLDHSSNNPQTLELFIIDSQLSIDLWSSRLFKMRGFRELSLVGRSLAQPSIVSPSASRICVFCQTRAQQPKRTFAQSSRVAASVQPEVGNQDSKTLPSISEQGEPQEDGPSLQPEFEYAIDPVEPRIAPSTKKSPQRLRRERRTTEVLAARRTKQRRDYSERKKDTDTRNANQEQLLEINRIVEDNPGSYMMAETSEGLRLVGAEPKRERASFEP